MTTHQLIRGLYAIADSQWNPYADILQFVEELLEGGCRLIQLRMKGASSEEVMPVAKRIAQLKEHLPFTFIVNDHSDVAHEVGADGVHLGKDDAALHDVRNRYGDRLLIGYSSHSLQEACDAQEEGADYVAFGAIFPTKTKGPDHPVQGIQKLQRVVEAVRVPVVAIGGVDEKNVSAVLEAGASAVAMISALASKGQVVQRTKHIVERVDVDQANRMERW